MAGLLRFHLIARPGFVVQPHTSSSNEHSSIQVDNEMKNIEKDSYLTLSDIHVFFYKKLKKWSSSKSFLILIKVLVILVPKVS